VTRIVTVCTGNICRSPAAELLLARRLADRAQVTSAGTHAMVGHRVPEPMVRCLAGEDIDGSQHSARQFTENSARGADLVVCMTSRHRAWVVAEAPFARDRTFLLTELAAAGRANSGLDVWTPDARIAITEFLADRHHVGFADVPDPYLGSQQVYNETFALIRSAVDDIVARSTA